jgi:hypothetical protein
MDDYDLFKVSIQSALVGSVTADLVAVTCGLTQKHLVIEVYFENTTGPHEMEFVRGITREVVSGFPSSYTWESRCFSIQQRDPQMLDFWAFLRAGINRRKPGKTGPHLVAS